MILLLMLAVATISFGLLRILVVTTLRGGGGIDILEIFADTV